MMQKNYKAIILIVLSFLLVNKQSIVFSEKKEITTNYKVVIEEIIKNLKNHNIFFEINCSEQSFIDMQYLLYDFEKKEIRSEKRKIFWDYVITQLSEYDAYSIISISDNYKISNTNMIIQISVIYSHTKDEKEEIIKKAKEISLNIQNLTDGEKIKYIHDFLIEQVEYDYEIDSLYAFSPVPFFKKNINNNKAICQGYALAFYILARESGLESRLVEGTLNNINHLWNMAAINGKWYHFDLTSDDELGIDEIVYDYYGLTDHELLSTHKYKVSEIRSDEIMDLSNFKLLNRDQRKKKQLLIFSDLDVYNWYYKDVLKFYNLGFIEINSKKEYKAEENITREEFINLIVKGFNLTANVNADFFSDVNNNTKYYNSIQIAKELNLISGYSDGSFKPKSNINREEAFIILLKAINLNIPINNFKTENILSSYTDKKEVSSWAIESFKYLVANDIIKGYNNLLNPKLYITKAESIVVIAKAINKN